MGGLCIPQEEFPTFPAACVGMNKQNCVAWSSQCVYYSHYEDHSKCQSKDPEEHKMECYGASKGNCKHNRNDHCALTKWPELGKKGKKAACYRAEFRPKLEDVQATCNGITKSKSCKKAGGFCVWLNKACEVKDESVYLCPQGEDCDTK